MAPIDMAYTKMLNDIVLLIVGVICVVIGRKGVGAAVNAISGMQSSPPAPVVTSAPQTPTVQTVASVAQNLTSSMNWMGYKNPDLDESWTPPPPPTTPPEHLEPDEERALLAAARKEAE
jgi:hypothetical protein